MKITKLYLFLILPLIVSGCSTVSKSIFAGAAIGGLSGGIIGNQQSENSDGSAVGAIIGAGLGSLIGYLSYGEKQKKVTTKIEQKDIADDWMPFVTKPKIRSYIVPDTIEGNKFIKSHRIFILDTAGEWSKD